MTGITDSMEWISEEQEKRLEAQGKRLLAITRNDVVAWREFIERQEMHGLCRMFEGLEIMEDGMVDFEKEKEQFERYEECLCILLRDFAEKATISKRRRDGSQMRRSREQR